MEPYTDEFEMVLRLNDPGHDKASVLEYLEKKMAAYDKLMNEAIKHKNKELAIFYKSKRSSLFEEWSTIKGDI